MLVLLFPGQGSQRAGMGGPWRDQPSWEVVERLSDVTGRDLATLLLDAGPDELRMTANAQIATFTLSLVALDAVRRALPPGAVERGPVTAVGGHSLGEYTALVAAGALSAEDGAGLVQARGDAMQAAAEASPGTMAAVLGLALDEVEEACRQVSAGAWVANDNAPGQVVVAGSLAGVEQAGGHLVRRGAKRVIQLQVGGAFHSPLMASAQGRLDAALAGASFSGTTLPVVANVDARLHTDGFGALLSAQLCSRVRWRESLLELGALGGRLFVELGPGTELSGMVRRTVTEVSRANVSGPEDIGPLVAQVEALMGSPA